MIDLHIHTNNSDGTDTVEEILKKAESLKLEYIAITDHDNCLAYKEMKTLDIKKYYSGNIIPGIEIKCNLNGRLIEFLGYNIDTDKIEQWAENYYKDKSKEKLQQKYFDILYSKCMELGLIISKKEDIKFDSKVDWASVTIFYELKSHNENIDKLPKDFLENYNNFAKKYCSDKNGFWYIDKSNDYPSIEETAKVIKDCGGLVFLAHVHIYRWIDDIEEHVKNLIDTVDLDGIECYHSDFSDKQIEESLRIAEKYNLYISGGSDYHGNNKKDIELGCGKGNLNIDKKEILNWI